MTEHIDDGDALLRRIPDRPEELWTRRADGTARPTSASMKPSPEDGGLSVDVRRLLPDPAVPTSVLEGASGLGLAEFAAVVPRANGLEVEHSPLDGNRARRHPRVRRDVKTGSQASAKGVGRVRRLDPDARGCPRVVLDDSPLELSLDDSPDARPGYLWCRPPT